MLAAQQTCGRVNMQPASLNIYPSRSFTEMLASAALREEVLPRFRLTIM
jgi:hypothetical protein